jgi:hypothetical protein
MAAVSYRLGQMGLDTSTINNAHAARKAVFGSVDQATGWLAPVVDPRDWSREGSESAEGQAFTLLLAAAYRDYVNTTGDDGDDIPIATGTSTSPVPTSSTGTSPTSSAQMAASMPAHLLAACAVLVYGLCVLPF